MNRDMKNLHFLANGVTWRNILTVKRVDKVPAREKSRRKVKKFDIKKHKFLHMLLQNEAFSV